MCVRERTYAFSVTISWFNQIVFDNMESVLRLFMHHCHYHIKLEMLDDLNSTDGTATHTDTQTHHHLHIYVYIHIHNHVRVLNSLDCLTALLHRYYSRYLRHLIISLYFFLLVFFYFSLSFSPYSILFYFSSLHSL